MVIFLQENAHFYVADMMIAAMEEIKCTILGQQHTQNWSVEEASASLGNDQADPEMAFYTSIKQESGSSDSSDSGYEGKWGKSERLCAVFLTYISFPVTPRSMSSSLLSKTSSGCLGGAVG